MPTFVLMTKLAPEAMQTAGGRRAMGKHWIDRVHTACPSVKFLERKSTTASRSRGTEPMVFIASIPIPARCLTASSFMTANIFVRSSTPMKTAIWPTKKR